MAGRSSLIGVVAVLVVVVFGAMAPIPTPAGAGTGRSIAVSPAVELIDGESVTISGSGFVDNFSVELRQCRRGADAECGRYVTSASVENDGTFEVDVPLRRVSLGRDGTVDCAVEPCEVIATVTSDTVDTRHPVAFDPGVAPPPIPSLSATPSEGLSNFDVVAVAGAGWQPNSYAFGQTCNASGRLCESGPADPALMVDDDGELSGSVTVRRDLLDEAGATDDRFERLDCAFTECFLVVEGDDANGKAVVRVPLDFAAMPPLPEPTLVVTPNQDLEDGDEVAVRGSGFEPGSSMQVTQCAASGTQRGCRFAAEEGVSDADAAGVISLTLDLRSAFWASVPGFGDLVRFDCGDPAVRCHLLAINFTDVRIARATLGFVDELSALPTFTGSPTSDLADYDSVQVAGTGFPRSDTVEVFQCARDGDRSSCRRAMTTGIDQTGVFSGAVVVRRQLRGIDCGSGSTRCFLHAPHAESFEDFEIDLHFDPSAEAIPRSLSAEPVMGLGDGQTVRLRGSGWDPLGSEQARLYQCAFRLETAACRDLGSVDANHRGDLDVSRTVRRVVTSASASIDCLSVPVECVVIALDSGDPVLGARVPLVFDPTKPLQPPHLRPLPVGLVDGAEVAVVGTQFSRDLFVSIVQCVAGSATRCDLDTLRFDRIDGQGAMTTTQVIRERIRVGNETFDCAAAVGRCELRVGSPEGSESAVVPLSFAPPELRPTVRAVREGDGLSTVRVSYTLSAPSARRVTAGCRTVRSTATPGRDYVHRSQRLSFEPGQTRQAFRVSILGDRRAEADEALFIACGRIRGAVLAGGWYGLGALALRNDD